MRPALPWWPLIGQAAAMWLASRVALAIFTYFAVLFTMSATAVEAVPMPPPTLLQTWDRWDALWYLTISRVGYVKLQQTAFFPLYPLLVHALTAVLGDSQRLLAAILVGNLGALLAFVGLCLLAANEAGTSAAYGAVRALAAYPLAFFLAAPYTDALFLGLAIFSLFFARRGVWRAAALCAFLAGLTRLTGVVLILPLFWEYARQHEWWRGVRRTDLLRVRPLADLALPVIAAPAGVGLYLAYLWVRFGDPLIFLRMESQHWDHQMMAPWTTLQMVAQHFAAMPGWSIAQARTLVDLAPLVLVAAITLATMRRQPVAFTLYMLGLLYLCTASPIPSLFDPLASVGRYLLASVPVFLALGRWAARYPWFDLLLVSAGFLLQGVFAAYFLAGHWII